jgi:CheY-like chemotaxis protein
MSDERPILLAEDNASDAELTLEAFAQHGFGRQVTVVRDGAEALEYLHRRGRYTERPSTAPCVILLDVKMPRANGLEVLRAIKTDEILRTIPVVMLSSSREEDDLRRSYELGANGYIVKPVDFSEFSRAVHHLSLFWGITNEPPPPVRG